MDHPQIAHNGSLKINTFRRLANTLNSDLGRDYADLHKAARALVKGRLLGDVRAVQDGTRALRECRSRIDDIEDQRDALEALSLDDKVDILELLISDSERISACNDGPFKATGHSHEGRRLRSLERFKIRFGKTLAEALCAEREDLLRKHTNESEVLKEA